MRYEDLKNMRQKSQEYFYIRKSHRILKGSETEVTVDKKNETTGAPTKCNFGSDVLFGKLIKIARSL